MGEIMDSPKVLDIEAVMERLEGDRGLFQEVVKIFFEGLPAAIESLRSSARSHDGAAFSSAAHACKGALGNIGAMRGWAKAFEMEQAGKKNTLDRADAMISEFEQEVAAFRVEYEKYAAGV